MTCTRPRSILLLGIICAALALTQGCGSGSGDGALTKSGEVSPKVKEAEQVQPTGFPDPAGKSLKQLVRSASGHAAFAPGTQTFTPGSNRLAFGVVDEATGKPIYAPTVVYISRTQTGEVSGPYPAPADPMVPQAKFTSKGASFDDSTLQAVYEANVDLPKAGRWWAVALTKSVGGFTESSTNVDVAASSRIPAIGTKAPAITTGPVNGIKAVDTRTPPAPSLHQDDFAAELGKQPIGLMFSSPAFCVSRVCGPVTDLQLQLQEAYGNRIAMIQQEAYTTYPKLTEQVKRFNLESEPWFFTVDKAGIIRGRLEGAFGINAMNAAIKAALKQSPAAP